MDGSDLYEGPCHGTFSSSLPRVDVHFVRETENHVLGGPAGDDLLNALEQRAVEEHCVVVDFALSEQGWCAELRSMA